MIQTGAQSPPFFYTFLFLFQGCSRTDRLRHQGDPAPLSVVPLS